MACAICSPELVSTIDLRHYCKTPEKRPFGFVNGTAPKTTPFRLWFNLKVSVENTKNTGKFKFYAYFFLLASLATRPIQPIH